MGQGGGGGLVSDEWGGVGGDGGWGGHDAHSMRGVSLVPFDTGGGLRVVEFGLGIVESRSGPKVWDPSGSRSS